MLKGVLCLSLLLVIYLTFSASQVGDEFDAYEVIGNRWYNPPGKIRDYFIAAVEIEWDYATSGMNLVDNERSEFEETLINGDERIGSIYTKVAFRRFTDATFSQQIHQPSWLGYLGPIIRAETGDTVRIHFRNFANGRNYSVHPHGFRYLKDGEGALYMDNTFGRDKLDDGVPPGGGYIYIWNITRNFAPSRDDENCLAGAYHSHTSSAKDINTGLVGLLLLCRRGVLSDNNERLDGFRDLVIYPDIVFEHESWKINENLQKCGNPGRCQQLLNSENRAFIGSNVMDTINGYMFGHLNFDVIEGEKLAVHLMGLNLGVHGIAIYGQTFTYLKRRTATINIYPATFLSTQMVPVNPGRWLLQCRVTTHYKGGMRGFLTVHRRNLPVPQVELQASVRRFYLAAEEVEWNYGPTGQNIIEGGSLTAPGSKSERYFERSSNRIGGVYKKARYFEYTNSSFCSRKPMTDTVRRGILGPVLRVAVGERVEVMFHNFASRPYSFLPHGVNIVKEEEGALYKNEFGRMQGKIAQPGGTVTYRFTVPDSVSPTPDDAQCLTSTYHSAEDPVKDIYSGLIGPLLVCKKGSLDSNGEQRSVDREFHLLFSAFDENESWYIDENIQRFALDPDSVNKTDPGFMASNRMSAINGFMYGNLGGLDMCLGEAVSWHVTGFGGTTGTQGTHFHGNTLQIFQINKDSQVVIPGSSYTGIMKPDNAGSWQVISRTNLHFDAGMRALYNVYRCSTSPKKSNPMIGGNQGRTRRYYIGAIETDWDYVPIKINRVTGENLNDPNATGHEYVKNDANFIGSIYRKVIYREFTDSSFTTLKRRTASEEHLEILGPYIKAEVHDDIEVTFRNFASRPYSIHPHGVLYDKMNEGAPYRDNSESNNGDAVFPGETYVYNWHVPLRAGPSYNDPNCIPWLYYSAVESVNDTNSGLVGPLVICRRGYLDEHNRRTDVDHEFTLFFTIFDEGSSWYLQQNIQRFAPNRTNLNAQDFQESNRMHAINGCVFGNLRGLVMVEKQSIAWYVMGLGSVFDVHTIHLHGQTFLHRSNAVHREDVIEVFPGTYETVEMFTDNPGTWLLHCHVSLHVEAGMEATYTILPSNFPRLIN